MAERLVIGLFATRGVAEDAANRLRTEGIPAAGMALLMLHDVAPIPTYVEPALAALEVDPLVWGNVRETFAPYISNGETALFVRTLTEADVDAAVSTIKQYIPVQIRVTPVAMPATGV
jgi:hypothetical protein